MANFKKTIICLAASRKPGGRCIAGKDSTNTSTWIRPVNNGDADSIDNLQSKYEDGTLAQVLDKIEISFSEKIPKLHQTENLLITNEKWIKKGTIALTDLKKLQDKPKSLWSNWNSSYNGRNDRINSLDVQKIHNSLYLINIDCTIHVKTEGKEFNNPHKKVRCSFQYGGTDFKLPVTDPSKEQEYLVKSEGDYSIGAKYICVSLGPVYEGNAYLFTAAIL
ncbi:hypothetical protein AGMMS50212_12340 [Spirochaetia bacterium]|nr:hypothetical protein AGMMS50212_12340 [Spirochaetia bacterium]